MRALRLVAVFAVGCCVAGAQDFPLHAIRIEGAERYPAEAIAELTGLTVGEPVNPERFHEGAQRLAESGFIASSQFRYEPAEVDGKAGYAVIYRVTEIDKTTRVLLDIPGRAEEDIWKALRERDPLILPDMPRTHAAEARYLEAVADVIAASGAPRPELEISLEGDLGSGRTAHVILPTDLPLATEIRVEGAKALPDWKAVDALKGVVLGQPITERRFLRYVVENVTPLYEEIGHLKVTYPRIELAPLGAGVAVTLHCEEGIEYQLGTVELSGEGMDAAALMEAGKFPVGKRANWRKVVEAVERVKDAFRRDGYLTVQPRVSRSLDDAAARADVLVDIRRGQQFLMGDLRLPGLDPKEEAKARKRWSLGAGEPLNGLYVSEFVKEAYAALEDVTGVSSAYAQREDTNVMDVVVTFQKSAEND